jgi:hypothetical protein
MRKFLLVTGAAVYCLGSSAFATTGAVQRDFIQGGDVGSGAAQAQSLLVLAANDKPVCDPVSPSKPCKGNNGFGNGADDGTPGGSGGHPGGAKCVGDTKC